MLKLFNVYHKCLLKHPAAVQFATIGTLMAAGDTVAQRIFESVEKQNYRRTLQFGLLGFCFIGPSLRYWYLFLEKMLGSQGKWVPIKKIAFDQTLFAPALQLAIIPILEVTNGHSFEQVKEKVKSDYSDVMLTNYKIWPAAQLINFYIIPLNYRVQWASLVGFFWNTYLAWKLGDKTPN